ncbi:16672_t:CDS:2, partial [Racocetra fulgida]
LDFPDIQMPTLDFPDIQLPKFNLSDVQMPTLDFPDIQMPEINFSASIGATGLIAQPTDETTVMFTKYIKVNDKSLDVYTNNADYSSLKMLELNSPDIQIPELDFPVVRLPILNFPVIQMPILNFPVIQMPILNFTDTQILEFNFSDAGSFIEEGGGESFEREPWILDTEATGEKGTIVEVGEFLETKPLHNLLEYDHVQVSQGTGAMCLNLGNAGDSTNGATGFGAIGGVE